MRDATTAACMRGTVASSVPPASGTDHKAAGAVPVQMMCARIGKVTGQGLAGDLKAPVSDVG
jgi:hypothetical protein